MGANPEPTDAIAIDELRALEASVLKALCLTINTAGSEFKYTILESVDGADFYFPLNAALFRVLADLHGRGEYVIASNLDEELRKAHDAIPENFVIDELFGGTLPGASDISAWIARMKQRATGSVVPAKIAPKPASAPVDLSQTQSAHMKEVVPAKTKADPPKATPDDVRQAAQTMPSTDFSFEEIPVDMSEVENPPSLSDVRLSDSIEGSDRSKPASAGDGDLVAEADDWSDYIDRVAFVQGKVFETGFPRLDEGLCALTPGLMLLVDHDRDRMYSFLKQVLDQVASGNDKPGLYFASELEKSELRLKTLARLGGVSASAIAKGQLKKESAEWARVEKQGRLAASWLSRVYVQEAPNGFELERAKKLVRDILARGDATCMVIVDSIEKAASDRGTARVVSELKALASELQILVLGATTDTKLLASREADLAAVFRDGADGEVEIEVLQVGREDSTTVAFVYDADTCRFSEK